MADPRFGMDFDSPEDLRDYIDDIVTNIGQTQGIDTQIVLRQYYQTRTGIHDHLNNNSPMAAVVLYDTENTASGSLWHARAEQYVKSNVYKYTGLNLVDFFQLPREYVDQIFRVCEQRAQKESTITDSIQQELNQLKEKS